MNKYVNSSKSRANTSSSIQMPILSQLRVLKIVILNDAETLFSIYVLTAIVIVCLFTMSAILLSIKRGIDRA